MTRTLVTGAGGFIGGHLVKVLLAEGAEVRATDIKPLSDWYQLHDQAQNLGDLNLNLRESCLGATHLAEEVYHLAADMGGMGFIENYKAACMLNVLNSTHMLEAAKANGVRRYFYSSTACVYRHDVQTEAVPSRGLNEGDVYPADPEDGYGWEKLFSERNARHYYEDYGLETRIARFHTIYGPNETWQGGREKVPAALSRKIAQAKLSGDKYIEVWGDGKQGRSFLYVDDCVRGVLALTRSECRAPLNIGSAELISVNNLARLLMEIAGYEVELRHIRGPLGVRGRYADITLAKRELNWEPQVSLRDGMSRTYQWIEEQVNNS